MRHHEPWSVRDPATVLIEILRRGRPRPGDVHVAKLTCGDTEPQAVLDVVRVHRGPPPPRVEASHLLRDHAVSLAGQREWLERGWERPRFVLVTVVARLGRVVPGPDDFLWLAAWRYSNHLTNAFDGDVYLVTDHGWTGCLDHRADFSPSLWAAGRTLVAV